MPKGGIVRVTIAEGVEITGGVEISPVGLSRSFEVVFTNENEKVLNIASEGMTGPYVHVSVYDAGGIRIVDGLNIAVSATTVTISTDNNISATWTVVVSAAQGE